MALPDDPKLEVLERYFTLAEEARFDELGEQFTEDAQYFHPPMYHDEWVVEGRDEIVAYFEERGDRDTDHVLLDAVVDGNKVGLVGKITGEVVDGEEDYFMSFAEFDGDQMSYYIAGLLKG